MKSGFCKILVLVILFGCLDSIEAAPQPAQYKFIALIVLGVLVWNQDNQTKTKPKTKILQKQDNTWDPTIRRPAMPLCNLVLGDWSF